MNNDTQDIPVLFVEDDKIAAFMGEGLLKKSGFLVDYAPTAEEAIRLFKEKYHSIIFMDIELPGMSGALATREIRAIEKKEKKPASLIFALTAHTDQTYRDHCFAMGMTDVIEKPLDERKLGMAKQMLLDFFKENQPLAPTEIADEHIDIKELMKITNNDSHKVLLLISEFLSFLEKMKTELEDDVMRKDKTKFIHSIHKLAATSSYIHAVHLCKLAKWIENSDSNASLQEWMPMYAKIMIEIQCIQKMRFDKIFPEKTGTIPQ